MSHLLILLFSLVQYGSAQQTLFPAAIPLAVRSPYLSSWDFTTKGTNIGKLWSTISAHQPDSTTENALSIPVHVRVDNVTYSFLGNSPSVDESVDLINLGITPTQTNLTAEAGPMRFFLTFLNPIEPYDLVKQSIPFSYLSLTAESLDGSAHSVQVYSDVSGEWLSGDRSQVIAWNTTSNNDAVYHTASLRNQAVFNEINTQAEWGTLYYAMKSGGNITFKTGEDADCRGLFHHNGTLDNQTDTNSRPISPNNPVFAISRDLGTIQATQDPVVWTVGLTTDPAIQYQDPSAGVPQRRSLFYKTQYPSDTALIPDFLNDFSNASSRAQQLDSKILGAAAGVSGSGALGDLVSLATAQVYGSIQVTVGSDANDNFDESDVMVFMKNIGGSERNRVNAVETLYSAFPAFMYLDFNLSGLLLEPLFRLQSSPSYNLPYAAADLGSNYPNVTISNSNHSQRVEQSGNMLIMTYAHALASGDGSLISTYYPLLTSWADYLSNYTLVTIDETSADGLTVDYQTNLAIKGIIAIEAMSWMSSVVAEMGDVDKYSNIAAIFYGQWKRLALDSDGHLRAIYGLPDFWTLGYNLFADVWLGTSLIDASVYDDQRRFLDNVTSTSNFSKYGMPVDNYNANTSIAASSWTLFAAAMTSDQDLRNNLISRVHNRASCNATAGVFPVFYDSINGSVYQGGASPAQGAMYAPLALEVPVLLELFLYPNRIDQDVPGDLTPSETQSHIRAIAGGSIGGVVALLVIGTFAFKLVDRRRRRKYSGSLFEKDVIDPDMPIIVTPFNPTLTGAEELDTAPQTHWLQPGSEPMEPETVPLVHPLNLSDSPMPSSRVVPFPIGLSSKELARLRAEGSHSQSPDALSSGPRLTAAAERSANTSYSDARGLQSRVEFLWHEMQQILAERIEAPPGYEDGGA